MHKVSEIVVSSLNQLVVEQRIQILGDVLRTRHLLVYVIQILLPGRREIDDIAVIAKLLNLALCGIRLQERTIIVRSVICNQSYRTRGHVKCPFKMQR